jgi:hypothetical protein
MGQPGLNTDLPNIRVMPSPGRYHLVDVRSPGTSARRAARGGIAAALAGLLLAIAACSSSPKPSSSSYQVYSSRRQHLIPLVVQCFISKGLLTGSRLDDPDLVPADRSSSWVHDGHLTRNVKFNDWYAAKGAGLTVRGKAVDTWMNDAAYNPAYWPAAICGPRPASVTPTPTYSIPGA